MTLKLSLLTTHLTLDEYQKSSHHYQLSLALLMDVISQRGAPTPGLQVITCQIEDHHQACVHQPSASQISIDPPKKLPRLNGPGP